MQKQRILILTVLILSVAVFMSAAKRFTLVIDAGHGGHDAGAVGAYSKEKNINLRTALAFGRYVEKNCPDVNVIYTRKSDVFVTLHGRADIANRAKADLFVSIHTNSLPSRRIARGLETYTLGMSRAADNFDVAKRENSVILVEKDYKTRYQGFDPNSAESYIIFEFIQDNNMHKSVEMAKLVQRNVCAMASRPNKGVKQAGFLVLRETSMPSCLVELGFISTPDEERLLNDENNIDRMARGLCKAFMAYRAKYDDSMPSPMRMKEDTEPVVQEERVTRAVNEIREQGEVEEKKEEVQQSPGETDEPEKLPPPSVPEQRADASIPVATVMSDEVAAAPVFKLQIFVSDRVLRDNHPQFKGENDVQYYQEGGMVKYTIGASTNYNEVFRLLKAKHSKFPGCFIVAFKNGEKMNVNQAIREFKANRR